MEPLTELSEEKISKYLDTTARAFERLRIVAPEPSWSHRTARDFLGMAESYYADARDFAAKGDRVNAFACVNYAHGWLDAGARLGVFDVGQDDVLFTLLD